MGGLATPARSAASSTAARSRGPAMARIFLHDRHRHRGHLAGHPGDLEPQLRLVAGHVLDQRRQHREPVVDRLHAAPFQLGGDEPVHRGLIELADRHVAEVRQEPRFEHPGVDLVGGEQWSDPLSYETLVRAPIKVSYDAEHLDVDKCVLQFKLSRPAGSAELVAIGEDGKELGKGSATYKKAPADTWLPIMWTQPAGARVMMLRAVSAGGLATSVELIPWSVAVEHEDVNFKADSAAIEPAEEAKLDASLAKITEIVKRGERFMKMKLYVAGHTDTVGPTRRTASYRSTAHARSPRTSAKRARPADRVRRVRRGRPQGQDRRQHRRARQPPRRLRARPGERRGVAVQGPAERRLPLAQDPDPDRPGDDRHSTGRFRFLCFLVSVNSQAELGGGRGELGAQPLAAQVGVELAVPVQPHVERRQRERHQQQHQAHVGGERAGAQLRRGQQQAISLPSSSRRS